MTRTSLVSLKEHLIEQLGKLFTFNCSADEEKVEKECVIIQRILAILATNKGVGTKADMEPRKLPFLSQWTRFNHFNC